MLAGRGRSEGRSRGRRRGVRRPHQADRARRRRQSLYAVGGAIVLTVAFIAAEKTRSGQHIAVALMRFMLFYAGVFALIALTASVGVGVAAADRAIMSPGGRIAAQAAHRAASFAAVGFLAIHITVEVLAGRSHPADAVVPFLDHGRTLYLGLGTVASDLVVLIVVTGLLRGRFASVRPAWTWRAMHAIAYLGWPLAILHGLLAGRTAKPYVDWSYGACVAAVALGIVFRFVAGSRVRETASSPATGSPSWGGEPGPPGLGAPPGSPGLGAPYSPGMAGHVIRRALPGPAGPTLPGPANPAQHAPCGGGEQ